MTDKNKKLIWVHPCVDCGCDCDEVEDDHYHVSIELPGVKKNDIDLKVIKSGLRLRAKKNDDIEYVSELKFLCDVKPKEVKANYEDGLLTLDLPFDCPDPFKGANSIKIS
ncbi:MAG: Hsp20/alpha crystallin family protein [Candidatus Heimdallarchaeota archaeon]|nr:Hsp20/alpha crystallin family protein [Candidatus Heimdallarchaeota archaeon]